MLLLIDYLHLLLLIVVVVTRGVPLCGVVGRGYCGDGPLAWLCLWLLDVSCPRLLLRLRVACPSRRNLLLPICHLLLLLLLLQLLLFGELLLLDELLLLLMGQVLLIVLRVLFIAVRVVHHFLIDVAKVLQDIHQHHSLLLYICLVGVADEIHVDLATTAGLGPLALFFEVERVFLIEMVKVLIADLTGNRWLVGGDRLPHPTEVEILEEWMGFDLFGSIPTKAHLRVGNQLVQDISGVW